jgi:heterotetrameric sarcosine oxidase gamma subunit
MIVLERRSPLAPVEPARRGALSPTAGAGVTLSERRPLSVYQVSAFAPTIAGAAARLIAAGFETPDANRMIAYGATSVRSTGPGIWQIVGPDGALPPVPELRSALRGVATVVDLSHARTALRVSGGDAVRVLAKHCPLNLDPVAFPAGSATNTRLGHLGVTLARVDDAPTFELLVFRGYAQFVTEMLCEAALEFGLTVR